LARRSQNRQTGWIIAMTFAITVMTLVIMAATIWPQGGSIGRAIAADPRVASH
jgi:hypothetical protein